MNTANYKNSIVNEKIVKAFYKEKSYLNHNHQRNQRSITNKTYQYDEYR